MKATQWLWDKMTGLKCGCEGGKCHLVTGHFGSRCQAPSHPSLMFSSAGRYVAFPRWSYCCAMDVVKRGPHLVQHRPGCLASFRWACGRSGRFGSFDGRSPGDGVAGGCQSRGVLRRHALVYDSSGPCGVGLAVLQENGFHFLWWSVGRLEGHGSVAAVAGDHGGWIQPRGFWRWWFFVYTDRFGNGNRKPQREGKDGQDVGCDRSIRRGGVHPGDHGHVRQLGAALPDHNGLQPQDKEDPTLEQLTALLKKATVQETFSSGWHLGECFGWPP